ncbi:unnamed protein product [Lampetra planeri]
MWLLRHHGAAWLSRVCQDMGPRCLSLASRSSLSLSCGGGAEEAIHSISDQRYFHQEIFNSRSRDAVRDLTSRSPSGGGGYAGVCRNPALWRQRGLVDDRRRCRALASQRRVDSYHLPLLEGQLSTPSHALPHGTRSGRGSEGGGHGETHCRRARLTDACWAQRAVPTCSCEWRFPTERTLLRGSSRLSRGPWLPLTPHSGSPPGAASGVELLEAAWSEALAGSAGCEGCAGCDCGSVPRLLLRERASERERAAVEWVGDAVERGGPCRLTLAPLRLPPPEAARETSSITHRPCAGLVTAPRVSPGRSQHANVQVVLRMKCLNSIPRAPPDSTGGPAFPSEATRVEEAASAEIFPREHNKHGLGPRRCNRSEWSSLWRSARTTWPQSAAPRVTSPRLGTRRSPRRAVVRAQQPSSPAGAELLRREVTALLPEQLLLLAPRVPVRTGAPAASSSSRTTPLRRSLARSPLTPRRVTTRPGGSAEERAAPIRRWDAARVMY